MVIVQSAACSFLVESPQIFCTIHCMQHWCVLNGTHHTLPHTHTVLRDKMVRIKQLEAQRKALCLARPKSAMYHLPCSMADLARAAAATSAASDVSSLSSSFAALRPRSSKSAHKHPILLMQNYTPEVCFATVLMVFEDV